MRTFHDRLCELEDNRSKAERCRALYEYEHFRTLPDDPRFAAEVQREHARLTAFGAAMRATVPDSRESEHPDATARRTSLR
jgi:hypothetical protein